jgi:hypothetical protein
MPGGLAHFMIKNLLGFFEKNKRKMFFIAMALGR